jgi:hypothetical protein
MVVHVFSYVVQVQVLQYTMSVQYNSVYCTLYFYRYLYLYQYSSVGFFCSTCTVLVTGMAFLRSNEVILIYPPP